MDRKTYGLSNTFGSSIRRATGRQPVARRNQQSIHEVLLWENCIRPLSHDIFYSAGVDGSRGAAAV